MTSRTRLAALALLVVSAACVLGVRWYLRRPPTYSRDVAPIVAKKCTGCHYPRGPAPFSLKTYRDVRLHAEEVAEVVGTRFMPPWPPDPAYVHFADERRLTEREIGTIQRWFRAGTPEGDPAAPAAPGADRGPGWQLGTPDLVLSMPEPFILPEDAGRDVFRNLVFPTSLQGTRYVRAVEFLPDPPRLVHHSAVEVDRTRSARYLDERDPGPGFGGMSLGRAVMPSGQHLLWTPGKVYIGTPGVAWPLQPGTDLVVQLHIRPSGKREALRIRIGLYFADKPPALQTYSLYLGTTAIDIPSGQRDYTIERSYTLPVDADALAVFPHAHYLARDMSAWAVLPDGTRRWLLKIPAWDFKWQDEYRYEKPVPLPRGTTITMRYVYDNSAENKQNLNSPPKRIVYGEETRNEMCSFRLQLAPHTATDLAALSRDYGAKMGPRFTADLESAVRSDPDNLGLRRDLADLYAGAGRRADATRLLREVLSRDPRNFEAYINLGVNLKASGDTAGAIAEFQRALGINERAADAHNNLGAALASQGRHEEALTHLRRALALWPDDARAHFNLGESLAALGQLDEAIEHERKALQLDPDSAYMHNSLGWALAMKGQLDQAIGEFMAALALRPGFAAALENLTQATRRRGRLGVMTSEGAGGLLVDAVVPDSNAGRAGLVPGDRILAIEGEAATKAVLRRLAERSRSEHLPLRMIVARGAERRELIVEAPGDAEAGQGTWPVR